VLDADNELQEIALRRQRVTTVRIRIEKVRAAAQRRGGSERRAKSLIVADGSLAE
jgi:hypothetical protein